jgi:hypothetical protein
VALRSASQVREFTGLDTHELSRVRDFFQGAVYCWCISRPVDWFSLRDLVGGPADWRGTPLFPLCEKHQDADDALEQAEHYGGWLLFDVITDDPRDFQTRQAEEVRQFRWEQAPAPTQDAPPRRLGIRRNA